MIKKEVSSKLAWVLVIFLFILLVLSLYIFEKYIEYNKEKANILFNLDSAASYILLKDYENGFKICEDTSFERDLCYYNVYANKMRNKDATKEDCNAIFNLNSEIIIPFNVRFFNFLEYGQWMEKKEVFRSFIRFSLTDCLKSVNENLKQ